MVEEVRVGLLGFRRDVEDLKRKVEERKMELAVLVEDKRRIRKDVQTGRALLEISQRLDELEQRLMVLPSGKVVGPLQDNCDSYGLDYSEEDSDEEGVHKAMSTSRLQGQVHRFLHIKRLMVKAPSGHPFLGQQHERMKKVGHTLLLDLGSALTQVVAVDDLDKERLLKIASIYRDMGEGREALKVLKSLKGRERGDHTLSDK